MTGLSVRGSILNFKDLIFMKNIKIFEKVPPVNSEVMVHLNNIESPGLRWVQNDMTRESQQRLPPAPVLLQSSLT